MKSLLNPLLRAVLGIPLLGTASAADLAANAGHEYVYVQATMSKDIWVVDTETMAVAGHIPIGDYTDDVIGSPDGKRAYGNAQIWTGSPFSWQVNEAATVRREAAAHLEDLPGWANTAVGDSLSELHRSTSASPSTTATSCTWRARTSAAAP